MSELNSLSHIEPGANMGFENSEVVETAVDKMA